MVYQNDPIIVRNCPEMWHYGCAYLSLAWYREKYDRKPWEAEELIKIWELARKKGIISGDLNKDGDIDDSGEGEIQDWTQLCSLLGIHLKNIPGHFAPDDPIVKGYYSICAWYNPITKFTHFVVGTKRPVEFDPISGGSRTVRNGYPKQDGLRVFVRIP